MKRVAAIYDVHGNLPALEAVLAEIRDEGVDRIVVGGDVLPGPMPRECLSMLLDEGLPTDFLFGNGEKDVLTLRSGGELTRVPERFHETMGWVERQLTPEQAQALDHWPMTLEMAIDGLGETLFCHATPRSDNELFTRLTPEDRLAPVFGAVGADLVICGHTHMQFDRMVSGVRVVNAGSVGMPFGSPGAFWVMLGPDVELRRTDYDLEGAAERIAATEYPAVSEFEIRNPAPEARMLEVFESAALS